MSGRKGTVSCNKSYLYDHVYQTCCLFPIIDEQKSFQLSYFMKELKKNLGLHAKNVELVTIIDQIIEIIHTAKNRDMNKIIWDAYEEALGVLNSHVKHEKPSRIDLQKLANTKCILLEATDPGNLRALRMFPSMCAVQCSDAANLLLPYLGKVPVWISQSCPELMEALGIKTTFTLNDYKSVLIEIERMFRGKPLDERHMGIVLNLINTCIYEECRAKPEVVSSIGTFPIPDANGVLCSSDSLCFNNCLWMVTHDDRSMFCHDKIPHLIAETLGLKTVRQDVLKKHHKSIPFGQKENLVKKNKKDNE